MVEVNRQNAKDPAWRKNRSEAQKKLCEDNDYVKVRTDAMNTPEVKEKALKRQKEVIAAMTDDERKDKYSRVIGLEQRENQRNSISGRIYIVKDGKRKVVKPEDIDKYLAEGWVNQSDRYNDLFKYMLGNKIGFKRAIEDIGMDVKVSSASKAFVKKYGKPFAEYISA